MLLKTVAIFRRQKWHFIRAWNAHYNEMHSWELHFNNFVMILFSSKIWSVLNWDFVLGSIDVSATVTSSHWLRFLVHNQNQLLSWILKHVVISYKCSFELNFQQLSCLWFEYNFKGDEKFLSYEICLLKAWFLFLCVRCFPCICQKNAFSKYNGSWSWKNLISQRKLLKKIPFVFRCSFTGWATREKSRAAHTNFT